MILSRLMPGKKCNKRKSKTVSAILWPNNNKIRKHRVKRAMMWPKRSENRMNNSRIRISSAMFLIEGLEHSKSKMRSVIGTYPSVSMGLSKTTLLLQAQRLSKNLKRHLLRKSPLSSR
jgi:hypothetical protein